MKTPPATCRNCEHRVDAHESTAQSGSWTPCQVVGCECFDVRLPRG